MAMSTPPFLSVGPVLLEVRRRRRARFWLLHHLHLRRGLQVPLRVSRVQGAVCYALGGVKVLRGWKQALCIAGWEGTAGVEAMCTVRNINPPRLIQLR